MKKLSAAWNELYDLAKLVKPITDNDAEPVTGNDVDAEASAEARREEAALQEMHPVEE